MEPKKLRTRCQATRTTKGAWTLEVTVESDAFTAGEMVEKLKVRMDLLEKEYPFRGE